MKKGQMITATIKDLGNSGEGVGVYQGCTVFIDRALPGETVTAMITETHKRYARASLVQIDDPSTDRVVPPCPIFDRCGGCQLMHLSYEKQLEVKKQKVEAAFTRIGKLNNVTVASCKPSPSSLHYRNKIQLPVRIVNQHTTIGLYARRSHELVEVEHCLIHCEIGEEAYQVIHKLVTQATISIYDPKTGEGELRHLLIKSAIHTQQLLVVLVTNQKTPSEKLFQLAKSIMEKCPLVKGVVHNFNNQTNNTILGKYYQTLIGNPTINEEVNGLAFKISAASFFQVNTKQAEILYEDILQMAALNGTETVIDAYCGVGTLSLILAKKAKEVKGVECVEAAIVNAKENALINQITNVSFYCDYAEEFLQKQNQVDLLLLNPPRQGVAFSLLEKVKKLLPKTIIYISCDPATLARDLAILYRDGYHIELVQPYDMFPQTAHVETVVKLRRG